jgi:hypothetical protein
MPWCAYGVHGEPTAHELTRDRGDPDHPGRRARSPEVGHRGRRAHGTSYDSPARARFASPATRDAIIGVRRLQPQSQLGDVPAELEGALPDVSYKMLRGGVDGRIPFGGVLALTLGFDYLGVLSAGEVYDRFTGPGIGAIDLRAGFAVTVTLGIEMRVMGDYTRFFYA